MGGGGGRVTIPEICGPAQLVFIAIPSYTGMVAAQTALSIIDACGQLHRDGIRFMTDTLMGQCYIDHARNQLCGAFLQSSATDLLFIDADLAFQPEAILRLCRMRRPVVGGLYRVKDDRERYCADFPKGTLTKDAQGLIPAKMLPTGLLRINRAALEAMDPPRYTFGVADERAGTFRAFFKTAIEPDEGGNSDAPAFWGEDTRFCREWRALGGKLWAVPDLTVGHIGQKTWVGNWAAHMAAQGKAK